MRFQLFVRKWCHRFGFDISRFDKNQLGQNPYLDMERFVTDGPSTTIFDVGANIGQTIGRFRLHFPFSPIHSFEPSPEVYRELEAWATSQKNVKTWNVAFGAAPGKAMLRENKHSVMNSFLDLGEKGWGEVEKQTEVEVRTIDDFCRQHNIGRIDILKSDTQGYDLQVLRGAEQMLRDNRIGLVLCEINFAEFYRNEAPFDAIFRYLVDRNFALVAFYRIRFGRNVANDTDALFVNKVVHKEAVG